MNIGRLIINIVVSAIAIAIAAFLTPGFSIKGGIGTLVIAAIIIGILDWIVQKVAKLDASPFGRGIVGFILAAVILFITGKIVAGFNISILGSILGALVLGIVDALIPGKNKTI
ncbi:phage holin family protein [Garciella nitratireducens]|uniref:4 TMS phage holin, superfamily IV n=1 Tax=Garciella nitratireducens DSM 15102 TaxID=1121911 RepID=A0A1T4MA19_9FIRM|nr:phage holin family protein [Garciella nitratireducens]RBP37418.1 superfamily IV 4 TMS phage holin [Garciella nitratireducens]SJZ63870.1 4 TMS phage holin, superfamily IV [Garciella nitratireducens DSM 15102]